MIVRCAECQTTFRVPDDKVPASGTMVRCSKCHATFWLDPQAQRKANVEQGLSPSSSSPSASSPAQQSSLSPAFDPQNLASARQSLNKKLAPLKDSWLDFPVTTEESIAHYKEQNASPPPPSISPSPAPSPAPPSILPPESDPFAAMTPEERSQSSKTPAPEELPTGIFGESDLGLAEDKQQKTSEPVSENSFEINEESAFQFEETPTSSILGDLDSSSSAPSSAPSILGDLDALTDNAPAILEESPTTVPTTSSTSPPSTTPPPPSFTPITSKPPKIELFLKDRKQTQRQFWFTVVPLVVKGFILLFLFLFSIWLWTSLRNENFALSNLSRRTIFETFVFPKTPWTLHNVKIRSYPLKDSSLRLMLIQGQLKNTGTQRLQAPQLKLLALQPTPKIIIPKAPCCAFFTPRQLARIHTPAHIQRLYSRYYQKFPYKRWFEISEMKPFHLIWLTSQPPRLVKIVPIMSKK